MGSCLATVIGVFLSLIVGAHRAPTTYRGEENLLTLIRFDQNNAYLRWQ